MDATRKIQVGLVGCGYVANQIYLPNLLASPFVEVVSVCDVVPDQAQSTAARLNLSAWFTDVNTMLDQADFTLLVNMTTPDHHAPVSMAGLRSGRHVFSEKPIATSLAQADALIEEANRRGVRLVVGPNSVMSPTFSGFHQVIQSGEIGIAHAAYGRIAGGGHDDRPVRAAWYYQEGNGALLDLGVYLVTLLTGMLGPAQGVVALAGIVVPTRRTAADNAIFQVTADDNTMVLIDFGNNCFASLQTGFSYGVHRYEASLDIVGTKGGVKLRGPDWPPRGIDVCSPRTQGEWEARATDPQNYEWGGGASYMARCLAEGSEPVMTAEHAYHVLEVMLGALKSARTGCRVDITSSFSWPLLPIPAAP